MAQPTPLDEVVRRRMRAQRRSGTGPELALRRKLWRMGLRYRVDFKVVGRRRRVDIAFTRAKVAVFCDGCFWHGCPLHGTTPKNNREWWQAKLAANVSRDRDTDLSLAAAGWTVIRVWEHEDVEDAVQKVVHALRRSAR